MVFKIRIMYGFSENLKGKGNFFSRASKTGMGATKMPSNSTYLYRLQKYLPVTFYTDWLFPWPLSILLASSHLITTENIGAVTKEGQDGADFCIAAMDKPRASCNFLVPIDWAPRVWAVSFFKDWKWKEKKRRVIKSLKHSILALNLFTSHWIKNAVMWNLLTMVFKGITKRKRITEKCMHRYIFLF